MKCLSWKRGKVTKGICVTAPSVNVPRIFLAFNVLPYENILQLYRGNPPDIRQDGNRYYIDDAYITSIINPDASSNAVLCKSDAKHAHDQRILLYVNTYKAPLENPESGHGFLRVDRGDVETLFQHTFHDGQATWTEAVVRLGLDSTLVVRTEARGEDLYAIHLDEDGMFSSLPLIQHYIRQELR